MNTRRTGTFLDKIVARKADRLCRLKAEMPLEKMRRRAQAAPAPRDFRAAIRRDNAISLIAELKKASPSKGVLNPGLDPARTAVAYEKAGAAAVSVITEQDFFLGSPAFVGEVRAACGLPVLRKDFLFDPYQIYESRALGADAVLVIAALGDDVLLRGLITLAGELRMMPLVEVHAEEELRRALDCGADVVGINNRNLRTMEVDLSTVEKLIRLVPRGVTVVAESGIGSRTDVRTMESLGVHAVLVGEAIVTAADVEDKIRSLLN
ncbi:MAG: indole-3-glycerol phosphate synthase TrpC [Planctomycetota bacterium]|nr:indole-3-glycerol phosphate synthase TrpC [Planctomycetota bacterium]